MNDRTSPTTLAEQVTEISVDDLHPSPSTRARPSPA